MSSQIELRTSPLKSGQLLNYTGAGLSARPMFFAPYNDVTIIVEDEGDENFYTNLFQKLLGNKVRITRVLGVGGKPAVVRHFIGNIKSPNNDRQFYVVDGDFDELIGINVPVDDRFFRLPRYDIESFLVEESAICHVAEEQGPKKNLEHYQAAIGFNGWRDSVIETVILLVAACALCRELGLIESYISQTVDRFVIHPGIIPDKAHVADYVMTVSSEQTMIDYQDFQDRLMNMLDRMGSGDPGQAIKWISGKNILLPLLCRVIRKETGRQISIDSLKFRLVNYCEFPRLDDLKSRVLSVAEGNT